MPRTKNDDPQTLCKELLEAESEKEVIKILTRCGYWDDLTCWRPFGDNENNWSTIGNQQGNPAAALVEKFVNSIDAVLMMHCYLSGRHPESNQAPQTITESLEDFFDIKDGNLANLTASERTLLAGKIGFVATGRKQTPNYIIFDSGEGQTPADMPDTLLSLTKSNKLRIPFVQGKFNMGGTGVLPFCGKQNFQLIISKRHPEILRNKKDDTADNWGFTLVRREEPRAGRRSSMFTYLAPNRQVPMFRSSELTFPDYQYGTQEIPALEWGTVIKLFEYEITGYKTSINLDLFNHISLLLPKPGLPIRFFEKRDYSAKSLESTMHGLHVRLQEDKRDNLEEGFPTSHPQNVRGESMTAEVYAFKKGRESNYRSKREGIIFVINGQTHGVMPDRFFSNKRINMGYIAESLLVIIDASKLSGRSREDLFMNSRDRVRKGDLYYEIEETLAEQLSNHQGLRDLRERRRREAIDNQLSNSKPLQEVLEDILKKSPTLEKLFVKGLDIGNPIRSRLVPDDDKAFDGKTHPTYFKILPKDVQKDAHINLRFRVQFSTDVVNDYFGRDIYPGRLSLFQNGTLTDDYVLTLWNGTATLTVSLPKDAKTGDRLSYFIKVEDDTGIEFTNEFSRHVIREISTNDNPKNPKPPPTPKSDKLALPQVMEVREDRWDQYGFNKFSALKIVNYIEEAYEFYINMDNVYLRNELKAARSREPKLLEAQFKFALVLIGMAILQDSSDDNQASEYETESPEDRVYQMSKSIAPIIIPMIDSLGELKPEDILGEQLDVEMSE